MSLPKVKIQRTLGPGGERLITMSLDEIEKLCQARFVKLYSETFRDVEEATPIELSDMSKSRVETMLGEQLLEQTLAGAFVSIVNHYFSYEMGEYMKKAPTSVNAN